MRPRRPAVTASTLGLAGAVLTASGAAAEPADRHVVISEDVAYGNVFGGVGHCTVVAPLDRVFGQAGAQDDVLSASTENKPTYPTYGETDCAGGEPSWMIAGVTLRWRNQDLRRFQTYTYTRRALWSWRPQRFQGGRHPPPGRRR